VAAWVLLRPGTNGSCVGDDIAVGTLRKCFLSYQEIENLGGGFGV
jgi:hypothetical protein